MMKKDLWTCPKCRHRFVTRNLWHSCVRVPLADHFKGKDPIVRRLFTQWHSLARRSGPVTVYAQKSRIVFQVRVRFAGAVTHKSWLEATLWLQHRADHPCLTRVEDFGRLGYVLHFRLAKAEDIDGDLAALMGEAYSVGKQDHLVARRL